MDNKISKNSFVAKIVLGLFVLVYSVVSITYFFVSGFGLSNTFSSIYLYITVIVSLVLFALYLFLKENKIILAIGLCIPLIFGIISSISQQYFENFYFCISLGLAATGIISLFKFRKFSLVIGGGITLIGLIIQIIVESINLKYNALPLFFNELFAALGITVIGILYLTLKKKNISPILWFIPVLCWLLGSLAFAIYGYFTILKNMQFFEIIVEVTFSIAGIILIAPISTIGLYISRLGNNDNN